MQDDSKKLEAHLFVCTNTKANGESCGPKGAVQLRDKMKAYARQRFPNARIRVNAAGCLGHCESGITAVCYPQGRWMTELTSESLPELEAALAEALEKRS